MNTWQNEIESALAAFINVAELAGEAMHVGDFEVEFMDAPHRPPTNLPAGKMAIYGFWWNDKWLKIGKAGPKSKQRYTYQHYHVGSAMSTLAGSLANDPMTLRVDGFDLQNPGDWIKAFTCRVNILIPSSRGKELLSLLEAFLHVRLKPKYEG